MSQYPLWKYTLILIICVVGVLYAAPNLYGEDPAIQVTTSRGFDIPTDLDTRISNALIMSKH